MSSSPVLREGPPFTRREDVSLVYPNCLTISAYHPLQDGREDTLRDKSPHLDVTLDSNCVFLKGTGTNAEPAFLTGHVVLTLIEPTSLKEITLQFRGKARLPFPANESMMNSASVVSYAICNHDWSFLKGDKKHSHTLKAGRHSFPFQLRIGGSLPSSISTNDGCAGVTYRLRAQATRPGFCPNLCVTVPIHVIRSFDPDALAYQQTLEIEGTWPDKLMYSIMLPHKAWAIGDTVTAVAKFSPLNKGISILSVETTLNESTSVYARSGSQDHMRLLIAVKHTVMHGKAVSLDCDSSVTCSSSSSSRRQSANDEDDPVRENNDVITDITIPIPSHAVPTHGVEPIVVSHRIRWIIHIANPDGHTSVLRCSLPIHILDRRLLHEARRHTAAARRLLIGGPEQEEGEIELPSYTSHVRDLIADLGPANIAPSGASNTSALISPSTPPLTPDNGSTIQTFQGLPSGYCTPLESSPFSHLSHVPESGDNMSLEWINSELLSGQLYRSRRRPIFHMLDEPIDSDLSRPTSRPASRHPSRLTSRNTSPDPGSAAANNNGNNTDQHQSEPNNQCHRNLHGFLKATMKPFTSIAHSSWLLKTGSHGNINGDEVQQGCSRHSHQPDSQSSHSPHSLETIPPSIPRPLLPRQNSQPSQVSHLEGTASGTSCSFTTESTLGSFLPRALTEVPNYDAASRTGIMTGVPPLTSLQGLPTYEEAVMSVGSDSVGVDTRRSEDPLDPPRPGFAFGPGQRTRSEPVLAMRMAGWGLSTRQP